MAYKRATGKCPGCGIGIVELERYSGAKIPCDTRAVLILDAKGEFVEGYVVHSTTCPAQRPGKPPPKPKGLGEDVETQDAKALFAALRDRLDGREPEGDV